MHLLQLPTELLQKIHEEAQKPGDAADDLWFTLDLYEHRARNKMMTQIILSNMCMDELEWQRLVDGLRSNLYSVFARTEACGARTVHVIGTGLSVSQHLLHGRMPQTDFTLVDDRGNPFVVNQITDCPLARALGGRQLLLLRMANRYYRASTYGSPSIRKYDVRVSRRRVSGSRGLKYACRELNDFLR